MNPNYPDGTPLTPHQAKNWPSSEEDGQELKKICQLLYMGLARVIDEMDRGGSMNFRDALFRMKFLAQLGAHKIYPGHSLQELSDFDQKIKADLAHPIPKKIIFMKTKINGENRFQFEDHGGNVGPAVECKDVREGAR